MGDIGVGGLGDEEVDVVSLGGEGLGLGFELFDLWFEFFGFLFEFSDLGLDLGLFVIGGGFEFWGELADFLADLVLFGGEAFSVCDGGAELGVDFQELVDEVGVVVFGGCSVAVFLGVFSEVFEVNHGGVLFMGAAIALPWWRKTGGEWGSLCLFWAIKARYWVK